MSTSTMDELGRVVIKSDIRDALSVGIGARFDVSVKDGAIILRPVEKVCAVCRCPIDGNKEMPLCDGCISEVKAMTVGQSN